MRSKARLLLRGLDPGEHLIRVPSRDGLTLAEEDVARAMTADVQIAVLPSVIYTGGQALLDMEYLTKRAGNGDPDRLGLLAFGRRHARAMGAWARTSRSGAATST